jgi:hypothetical protein
MTAHLKVPIPSPVIVEKLGTRFRNEVKAYAATHQIPVMSFTKSYRKQEVMARHIAR